MEYKLANEDCDLRVVFDREYFPKTVKLIIDKVNDKVKLETEKFLKVLEDYKASLEKYPYIYFTMDAVSDEGGWSTSQHYYRDEMKDSSVSEALISDLKILSEKFKEGTLTSEKYVVVRFNYEVDLYASETRGYDCTFFLPWPEDFTPTSDSFYIVDYEYDEMKYGDYIVID